MRYGKLVVLREAGSNRHRQRVVLCRCDCGVEKTVVEHSLKNGDTVSCGCHRSKKTIERSVTHGLSRSKIYATWRNMKNRCELPSTTFYKEYGGRGIRVCDRWQTFESFLTDMGLPLAGQKIERLDNDGNYEPGNCVWVDSQAQANNRRSSRILEHDGKSMTIAEWGRETGLGEKVIGARLRYGWGVERALTEPLRRKM